ncbi:hypothetical protein [Saccharothrix stipae]
MAPLIADLAMHMLDLTRVTSNAPAFGPHEPLRVDIVPGFQAPSALDGLLASGQGLLRLSVEYKIMRDSTQLIEGADHDFVRTPKPYAGAAELLSTAFLLKPRLRFVSAAQPKELDFSTLEQHKLQVSLVITTPEITDEDGKPVVQASRVLEIPFFLPTIDIPLPLMPAVCVCSKFKNLSTGAGSQFLVLAAPGGPSTVSELAATYNQVIGTFIAVRGVLDVVSVVLNPLKKLVDTLAALPEPFVSTDEWVLDFDDFADFDDEMSSFLLIAPTGTALQFSNEANPTSWDVSSDIGIKTYWPIDLLQLVDLGSDDDVAKKVKGYVREKLGLASAEIEALRTAVATANGIAVDDGLQLGLAVLYVDNLGTDPDENPDYDRVKSLLYYETAGDTQEEVHDDVESARWVPAHFGL